MNTPSQLYKHERVQSPVQYIQITFNIWDIVDEVRKGWVAIQNLGRRNSRKKTVDDLERRPEDATSEDGSGSKIVKLMFV
jgi:hypothetical protein